MACLFRCGALAWAVVLSVACGNGDDLVPNAGLDATFPPVVILPAEPALTSSGRPVTEAPAEGEAGDATGDVGALPVTDPDGANFESDNLQGEEGVSAVDPGVCVTPPGVSGSPRNLSEALILMNSLPKPVSLACFLQALERPLSLYSTSSKLSLQPSPGERSPRTFIVFEPLVMSIVFDGPAQAALEFGYRTTPTRSVKTEFTFPLEADVTFDNLFDEVRAGEVTKCGQCHIAEVRTFDADLPVDVFESDIIEPYDLYEVSVDALRAERASCDMAAEPERCALLSAVFDHGEVLAAPQGILF